MLDRNGKTGNEEKGSTQADAKLAEVLIHFRRKGERKTNGAVYCEYSLGDFITRTFYLRSGHV